MKPIRKKGKEMETVAKEDIMDVKEASEYLRIKQSTLYKYVNGGIVPGFKIGNLWRFRRTALDGWIEEQMQEPQKENVISARQARNLLRGSGKGENLGSTLLRLRKEDLKIEEAKG